MSKNGDEILVWEVEFHEKFVGEFDKFEASVQDGLLVAALALARLGPVAGRPLVGTLSGSKHGNLKELRFKSNNGNEIWRAAFAFDPISRAIVLCAADKQGKPERLFYKNLVKTAELRFDEHLEQDVRLKNNRKKR